MLIRRVSDPGMLREIEALRADNEELRAAVDEGKKASELMRDFQESISALIEGRTE